MGLGGTVVAGNPWCPSVQGPASKEPTARWALSYGACVRDHRKGRARNSLITTALMMSMKKAPTMGTTRKARWEGPKRWVMACMLAMAVGGGAEAEAAVTRRQHGRIIVAPHDPEGDEDGERHGHRLHGQQDEDGQGQACQLPQPEAHQRHGEEERQADVAEQGDPRSLTSCQLSRVSRLRSSTPINSMQTKIGNSEDAALEVEGQHFAPFQADGDECQGLDQAEGGERALHVRHLEALGAPSRLCSSPGTCTFFTR